jgi:hypothetical protein
MIYNMSEFDVYRMYMALKLHFTTDNYDVIKNKGRVKASRKAFAKRSDLYSIKKISKTYTDSEVANFLVANFTCGDRWGGVFDAEAGDRYTEWKKRIESLTYVFEKDLDNLIFELEDKKLNFEHCFVIEKNDHPYIIKSFLRKTITLETLVIIEKLFPFLENFDKNIQENIIWPDISRMIRKYKPFLKFDKEKYDAILRRRIGHNNSENSKS